jgi:GT2 family glycosyltransferase
MPPLVTLALPTWRGERHLASALDAALAQTFEDREVLVVDDASNDGTFALAARYADRPGVRIERNERNLGLVGNWNRCLDLALGALVCVTHQDDVLDPRFLERAVAALERHPGAAFVHARSREVDDEGRPTGAGGFARDHEALGDVLRPARAYAERLIAREPWPICCPGVLARRAALERAGRFDPAYRFAADVDMWLRLLETGDAFYLGAEPLIDYRRHPSQATALESKLVRYLEVFRARRAGMERLARAGVLGREETARCKAGLARQAVKIARKFARASPEVAREHLALAYGLHRRSLFSTGAVAAAARLLLPRRGETSS